MRDGQNDLLLRIRLLVLNDLSRHNRIHLTLHKYVVPTENAPAALPVPHFRDTRPCGVPRQV